MYAPRVSTIAGSTPNLPEPMITYCQLDPQKKSVKFQSRYKSFLCRKCVWKCRPQNAGYHDDVIKWEHFLCYWFSVRGIRRSSVESAHNSQWRGALMLRLICAWTNGWASNRDASDLIRHHTHYNVTVMNLFRPRCVLEHNADNQFHANNWVIIARIFHLTCISNTIQWVLCHREYGTVN